MSSADQSHDLVVVATFSLPGEAEVAASFLDAYGIPSTTNRPFVSGLRPSWFPGILKDRGVTLEVRAEDAEAARELLEGIDPQEPEEA